MKLRTLLATAIAVALAFLVVTATAAAATKSHSSHRAIATATASHQLGSPELRPGATGPDVAALQWLLSGHRPFAFKVKPTLTTYEKGISGDASSRTWRGVKAMKFRIGYPGVGQCRSTRPRVRFDSASAGPYFFALLLGHKQRPACWVALAAKRIARAEAGATTIALKLRTFEISKVGIAEPQAYSIFNAYFNLPPEAWCAIFQGYSMRHVGLALFGAANPWYVPSIIEWGRFHGYLRATAKVGEWVLYYGDISHIGYVIGVDPKRGWYATVEGNWNDRVAIVQHTATDHLHYFLAVPGVA